MKSGGAKLNQAKFFTGVIDHFEKSGEKKLSLVHGFVHSPWLMPKLNEGVKVQIPIMIILC